MMTHAFGASTFVSSAMALAAPDVVTSGAATVVEAVAQSNTLEACVGGNQVGFGVSGLEAEAVDVGHWSATKNARFKELARNEALTGLSIEDFAELETLTRLRRFEKYPRSADEILWQRRQQKVTRGLVEALEAYVHFHETPRRT